MRHTAAAQDDLQTSSSTPATEYAACCFRIKSSSTCSSCQSLIVAEREGQTDHRKPHSLRWLVLIFGIAILKAPSGTLCVKMDARIIIERGCLLFCGGTRRCPRKRWRCCSRHYRNSDSEAYKLAGAERGCVWHRFPSRGSISERRNGLRSCSDSVPPSPLRLEATVVRLSSIDPTNLCARTTSRLALARVSLLSSWFPAMTPRGCGSSESSHKTPPHPPTFSSSPNSVLFCSSHSIYSYVHSCSKYFQT